jgi:ATP-dependent Clp protease ATP-binding subunit ClpX
MGKFDLSGGITCSFCHKNQREVDKIIAGPKVYICSECISLCNDIIKEDDPFRPIHWGHQRVPPPSKIKAFLDNYIVGQDHAKKKVAVAVYNHYKRIEIREKGNPDVEIAKSNVLMLGPTGTGKTLIAQTLARFLDVPFVIADATSLTEAGYVGEDVENIILNLYHAAKGNIERTTKGIVYIDEIDKIAKKNYSSSVNRDVSGEGVQQALLKILEGTHANIQIRGNKKLPNQEYVQIDTTNILFFCGGSFDSLERIIEARVGQKSIGYDAKIRNIDRKPGAMLNQVTTEDLEKFGFIPEFIGRLPVVATLDGLSEPEMVEVLTKPKNSLIKQYQKLFKFENMKLSFTDEALSAIAHQAIARGSGARGLRAILEEVMLEIMYEIPSLTHVKECVVDVGTVQRKEEPRFILRSERGHG